MLLFFFSPSCDKAHKRQPSPPLNFLFVKAGGEWPQDVSLSGWLISFQTGLNLTSAMWHSFSKQGLDYHGEKLTGQAYTYHYLYAGLLGE